MQKVHVCAVRHRSEPRGGEGWFLPALRGVFPLSLFSLCLFSWCLSRLLPVQDHPADLRGVLRQLGRSGLPTPILLVSTERGSTAAITRSATASPQLRGPWREPRGCFGAAAALSVTCGAAQERDAALQPRGLRVGTERPGRHRHPGQTRREAPKRWSPAFLRTRGVFVPRSGRAGGTSGHGNGLNSPLG